MFSNKSPSGGYALRLPEDSLPSEVSHISPLVALPFVSPHVAAAFVLSVGTWQTALISLQQMAESVGAAARVAGVNCRAAREQRKRLRWATVVPEGSESWVGIVLVAGAIQVTATIAAQAKD
jgi:hypothetical protein